MAGEIALVAAEPPLADSSDDKEMPIGALPDDAPAPAPIRKGVAPSEVLEPRPQKRGCSLMCFDLIEDQMRSRMVAVFVALILYLVVGSDLIRFSTPPEGAPVAPPARERDG